MPRKRSELPAPERLDRLFQSSPLIGMRGRGEKTLVRLNRQIHGLIVVLGARQARGVIGEVGFRQLVQREAGRYLLPTRDALARIGLGQCPQMPGCAVVGVGRDGARRQIALIPFVCALAA